MNTYNIEVGDTCGGTTVTVVDSYGISFSNSASVGFWAWNRVNRGIAAGTGDWKLVKKNKGKVIGYTLLKDTPEAKKDTVLKLENKSSMGEGYYSPGDTTFYHQDTVESQPEWFSPIYEEVKPTEVKVQTNAGEVTVTNSGLSLSGETPVGTAQALAVFDAINKAKGSTRAGSFAVETFKVGCKTFHVSDIPKLEAAIKQVS